ncbi:TPA: hypothetical protein ACSP31_000819 [Aeromonas veronii]
MEPQKDFVGDNKYKKKTSINRIGIDDAGDEIDGGILPGCSKEQHNADTIEAMSNMYGCLLSIVFIFVVFSFIYAVSYACNVISPNNKELPVYVVGLISLVLVATYLAKKASAIAKALIGKALSMAPTLFLLIIWLVSFAYLYIGFVGISYFIGSGWATLTMAAILVLRADMVLPIAVFFGANYGFGLSWISAVALAIPSLVIFSLFSIAGAVRSFKWR